MKALPTCLVILSLSLALLPGSPGAAQAPASAPSGSPPAEVLLALPLPSAAEDIAPIRAPGQASAYARALTRRQAGPLQAELGQLQARGVIAGFELRPDLHGVLVQLARSGRPPLALTRLRGVAAVMPAAEAQACGRAAAQALQEELLAAGQEAALHPREVQAAASPQAVDPTIDVYRTPDGYSGRVYGYAAANTPVTMTIYRADGSLRVTRTTTSSSTGYYVFRPSYRSCPSSGYDWVPGIGDTVVVSAGGRTASTVVVPLTLWADPGSDVVAGLTAPGRSVEVEVLTYPGSLCSGQWHTLIVGTDPAGNFQASFAGSVDLLGNAYAYAYARDTRGNSTNWGVNAYTVGGSFDWPYEFYGYLKPGVPYTATLSRGGLIVEAVEGVTSGRSYLYGSFSQDIQAGDVVQVSGGGASASLTATSLSNVALNPATDSASGTTGAGRRVEADFEKESYWPSYNGCDYDWSCADATADGAGHFDLTAGFDLDNGDLVWLIVYDAAGNSQYADERYAPLIVAEAGSAYVSGTWTEPHTTLNALLRRGATVIDTQSAWVDYGTYGFWFSPLIKPGDRIEVTDGAAMAAMTVQDVTARVDSASDRVYGRAPRGPLTLLLWNYSRDDGYWSEVCRALAASGGTYSLSFAGETDLLAADEATAYLVGSDGHKTSAWGHAFYVGAVKDDTYLYGYTVEPGTAVHLTLRDPDQVPKATADVTSGPDGYYDAFLSAAILQGDRLDVATDDGWASQVAIPELTVAQDAAANRLYGRSPGSQPVRVHLSRWYNHGGWGRSFTTWADAAGDYAVPLAGLYWSRDCSPVQAGGRCTQAEADYYNPFGHLIWIADPYPSPAGADAFEDDDTYTSASVYAAPQSHTFHDYPDDDWVQFNVPAEDVAAGVAYHVQTANLGWGMATQVRLYASDGTTLLWEEVAYESRGRGLDIGWVPAQAGTYYLVVSPPSSDYAGYCDAVYDLRILPVRARAFLPALMRAYDR